MQRQEKTVLDNSQPRHHIENTKALISDCKGKLKSYRLANPIKSLLTTFIISICKIFMCRKCSMDITEDNSLWWALLKTILIWIRGEYQPFQVTFDMFAPNQLVLCQCEQEEAKPMYFNLKKNKCEGVNLATH